MYCFDLAFTPEAAVGPPFLFNNATVATGTPPNGALSSNCPSTHRDTAVQTFAANTSEDAATNLQVVFE